MKSKVTQGIVIFVLALLLGFYGSSVYHAQKSPDPKATQQKAVRDRLDRRFQTASPTHPIVSVAEGAGEGTEEKDTEGAEGTEDTLSIQDISDINAQPNKSEVLTQWGKEWRNSRPQYKDQTAVAIYIVDPTKNEMWQVASPQDAEKIIKKLDSLELVQAPEAGMDLGFMILTEEKRHNLYVTDSPETEEGKSVRAMVETIKKRSLLSVDLFQLILEDQIESVSFTGYVRNAEGSIDKIALNTDDKKTIEEVLQEFRKIHVISMTITNTSGDVPKVVEPEVYPNHYQLVLNLSAPYEEGSKIEIVGYPLAFFAEFTPQQGKMRAYTVEVTTTTNLLSGLTGISLAEKSAVSETDQDTPLQPDREE